MNRICEKMRIVVPEWTVGISWYVSGGVMVRLVAFSLLTAAGLIGCATVRPVQVLTDSKHEWSVGQHDSCAFHKSLICYNSAEINKPNHVDVETLDYILKNDGDKDGVATALYDVKFSSKLEEYSIWDCIKTGSASPALECKLAQKPDKEDIARQLKEHEAKRRLWLERAQATHLLAGVTQETLVQKCGQPVLSKADSISVSQLYKGHSKFVAFHFSTYGSDAGKLTLASIKNAPPLSRASLDHTYVLSAANISPRATWYGTDETTRPEPSFYDTSGLDGATEILEELPCLK